MASDAAINSRYAVVITRHRTQSGEPGASVADGVQDADTAPEPRPAEPATPSTAALRSAGGDDFCMVDEAVDHGGCYHVVTEDFAPAAEGLVAGDDQAGPLISGRYQLEEQVSGLRFERDVAEVLSQESVRGGRDRTLATAERGDNRGRWLARLSGEGRCGPWLPAAAPLVAESGAFADDGLRVVGLHQQADSSAIAASSSSSSARRKALRRRSSSSSRAASCPAGSPRSRALASARVWLAIIRRNTGAAVFFGCAWTQPRQTRPRLQCSPVGSAHTWVPMSRRLQLAANAAHSSVVGARSASTS